MTTTDPNEIRRIVKQFGIKTKQKRKRRTKISPEQKARDFVSKRNYKLGKPTTIRNCSRPILDSGLALLGTLTIATAEDSDKAITWPHNRFMLWQCYKQLGIKIATVRINNKLRVFRTA